MCLKRIFWAIVLLALLLPMLTVWYISPVTAAIRRVPQDYPTIQAAVNAAKAGDTIQVSAATYYERVTVDVRVTIVGENPATTVVDAGGTGTAFTILVTGVEIRGFTIRNGGNRYYGIYAYLYGGTVIRNNRIFDNVVGVLLADSDGNTIEGNNLFNNSMYGIQVKGLGSNTLRNNTISESAYGIELSDSPSNQITNNTIHNTSYGLYVAYSNNNNASANTLCNNSWNIYLTHSNSNIVGNNAVSGGSAGIQVMRSQGNTIINNTVTGSSYGVYITYCLANTVSGNTASLNDWGIELYNSTGSTIKENMIKDSTWGFYLAENSKRNYIYHNNIINNVKQVFQDPTSSPNTWNTPTAPYQGNYWSDYTGADDGSGGRQAGDGIGDTKLPWAGVDYYPLMSPWGVTRDVAIVNVTLSATKAYVGEVVTITVVAENQGTWAETFNVTTSYENTTLGILRTIGTQRITNLDSGANTTIIFSWDTTNVQPGVTYTIKAKADVLPGETDTSDNALTDGLVQVIVRVSAYQPTGSVTPLLEHL